MGKRSNEFQALVAYIYSKVSAPFKVTESALVDEIGTGAKREIDILLEGAIAGVEVKIAIECRDRKRIETIEWIDSLIGKFARLRMNKVVAVSSQGFSQEAKKKANDNNIELITASDAQKVDWAKELLQPYFDLMTHQHELLRLGAYDSAGRLITFTDVNPDTHVPSHQDKLSAALYPILHDFFFKHCSRNADEAFNEFMMHRWMDYFKDPTPRYWEITIADIKLEVRSEDDGALAMIAKIIAGIGTRFSFQKTPASNTVIGEHMLTDVQLPADKGRPLSFRVVRSKTTGIMSAEIVEK